MSEHAKQAASDDFSTPAGLRIVLPSTFLGVRQACLILQDAQNLDEARMNFHSEAELVLAEALNNIVEHSYHGTEGLIEIEVQCRESQLHFSLIDDGIAMPEGRVPLGQIPDFPTDPEKMPEGGFGWFLIHDLTQDLSYQRRGDRNILQFSVDAA